MEKGISLEILALSQQNIRLTGNPMSLDLTGIQNDNKFY